MSGLYGIRFYVVYAYFVKYDNTAIDLTWCDWEAAYMITVELSSEVGDCHIDMVCFVISFVLWYWCHGVLFFGDGGLIYGARSLEFLFHVAHICFCCDFDVTAYSCWCEAWPTSEVLIIYGFAPCGDDSVSQSGMIIFN